MSTRYFFMDSTPVDPTLASDKREAWMPASGSGYFDAAARRHFETRTQKRAWLRTHGMRETGELYRKGQAPPGGNMRRT